jgi:hypothetical protein
MGLIGLLWHKKQVGILEDLAPLQHRPMSFT